MQKCPPHTKPTTLKLTTLKRDLHLRKIIFSEFTLTDYIDTFTVTEYQQSLLSLEDYQFIACRFDKSPPLGK